MNVDKVNRIIERAHANAKDSIPASTIQGIVRINQMRREAACNEIVSEFPELSTMKLSTSTMLSVLRPVLHESVLQTETLQLMAKLINELDRTYGYCLKGFSPSDSYVSVEIRNSHGSPFTTLWYELDKLADPDTTQYLTARLHVYIDEGVISGLHVEQASTYAGEKLYIVAVPLFNE